MTKKALNLVRINVSRSRDGRIVSVRKSGKGMEFGTYEDAMEYAYRLFFETGGKGHACICDRARTPGRMHMILDLTPVGVDDGPH